MYSEVGMCDQFPQSSHGVSSPTAGLLHQIAINPKPPDNWVSEVTFLFVLWLSTNYLKALLSLLW